MAKTPGRRGAGARASTARRVGLQRSVQGRSRDAEDLGDDGDGLVGVLEHPARGGDPPGVELPWSASLAAAGTSGGEACQGVFADELAFELGERAEDVEHELAGIY